jgi:CRP-like cAMP-binding protein
MAASRRITLPSNCTSCPRRQETEWCDLTADELKIVNNFKRDRLFEPGEVLYNQGDSCEGVFCIREGLVGERHLEPDGESTLLRLNHAGTTIGYQEFLTKTAYRNSAEVLQESHICFLYRQVVTQLLAKNPSLGERFLSRSIRDFEQIENSYIEAMTMSIRGRLLHALLILYEHYGCFEATQGHFLEIPIARHDLAELVGTAPETISRTIRKLQEDRLVKFEGRMVHFPNLDAVYNEITASN